MLIRTLIAAISLLLSAAVFAQDQEDAEAREALATAEARQARADVEMKMREAEERLAEAARQIAELSQRNMTMVAPEVEMFFEQDNKPRLGVTIAGTSDPEPVDGVELSGITPGSAAEEAGLRAGDIITAINGESLKADSGRRANEKLIEFMSGVEEGDKLDIDYLRDGNSGRVELTPRPIERRAFVFRDGQGNTFDFLGDGDADVLIAPNIHREVIRGISPRWIGRSLFDMELVELSEGLGKYFGTDSGLLVVRVAPDNELKLRDGDVIQSIDGREPNSVGHLMRILSSYAPGESFELRIMRDKKRQNLELEMPNPQTGYLAPPPAMPAPVQPTRAPVIEKIDRVQDRIRT